MVVSTYQAASGGGVAMLRELEQQAEDHVYGRSYTQEVLDRPYLFNLFSHDSPIGPDGYNEEERKLAGETHHVDCTVKKVKPRWDGKVKADRGKVKVLND